jgi:HEAT repeat protein
MYLNNTQAKMIRKILGVMLLIGLLLPNLNAQDKKDERTVTTRIADLLAELPAKNTQQFNRNMNDIAQLGVDGYHTLIIGLNAKDNEAVLTYAISGFSSYASQNGKTEPRKIALDAYKRALTSLTGVQHKSFILSQFDIIGNDEVVAEVAQFLTDEALADPAARALAKINTTLAKNTLLKALASANGRAKLSIIGALGHTDLKAASPALISILNSTTDANTATVGLLALAQLADPASEPVLQKAAAKAGYAYEPTNAVSSYLIFANKMLSKDKVVANKIAKDLAGAPANVRIAALELLGAATPTAAFFAAGLSDPSFAYRAAALKAALPSFKAEDTAIWLKQLKSVDAPTQVILLQFLASANAQEALPAILKLTKSNDQEVRKTAIVAAGFLGQERVLPEFLKNMKQAGPSDLPLYTEAILKMKGDGITKVVADALPKATPSVQIALINVLSAKAATTQSQTIFNELSNKDAKVQLAAYGALKQVVSAEQLPQLYVLLNESKSADQATALQSAVIAALKTAPKNEAQVAGVLAKMKASPSSQQALYYPILASLGGSTALATINEDFKNGSTAVKDAALKSLASWTNFEAAQTLINIARTTKDPASLDQAIKGYLKLVKAASLLPEQRLLCLINAMEVAKTTAQKQQILNDAEQAKIFNTLVFASKYLTEAGLQQSAATTVMNVALAGKYNGELVKNMLNQTIAVITGADSDYQKEAMRKYIADMESGEGFVSIYNGKDLTGWQGLVGNPISRAKMDPAGLAAAQEKANKAAIESWKPINDELHFMIKGDNLATVKKYGDFEMLVDWKIIDDKKGEGDAGIYLRGTPQVQMWDNARTKVGAQVGSGGLYNNQVNESKPLKVADNILDEWNTFRIVMKADRVTVYLNGVLVTDNVILENYWDRKLPIFSEEQIELQAHGSPVAYRNIFIKELPRVKPFELSEQEVKEGYKVLFDGTNMHNWTGNTTDYVIENGNLAIRPKPGKGSGGNLFTKEEYSDFIYRFEFKLTPGANNGLGIRAPLTGDAAYEGMELQILDNEAPVYKNLKPYQYHGSIYGVSAAKRGFLKPTGEWNYEEVIVKGSKIKVVLNGEVIVDADIKDARKNGAIDGNPHPGLLRDAGHIGFLGHGSPVEFRNIRIKDLSKK